MYSHTMSARPLVHLNSFGVSNLVRKRGKEAGMINIAARIEVTTLRYTNFMFLSMEARSQFGLRTAQCTVSTSSQREG
jgi:hypothetical protein